MLLTLDNLATRYHLLPSEVASQADTFDIYVMDVSAKWNQKQQARAANGGIDPIPELTQEEMAIILYGE